MAVSFDKIRRVKGKDAKLFGVLSGISKHLDPCWDPLIIRLIFLVLAALSGFVFMFALYFVLALILKPEDPETEKSCYHRIKRTRGKEARICGVIGGISKHLDPERDPFIFRLAFFILAALSGFVFMFGLYFLLAMLLHREDEPILEENEAESVDGNLLGKEGLFKEEEDKEEEDKDEK